MACRREKESSVPLYQHVMHEIRSKIESGEYQSGSQIPTELELSTDYNVGRVTVRRAIEELVGEGLLTKQQGRGTFVNAPKLMRKVQFGADVRSFSAACRDDGMEPNAELIARYSAPVGGDIAEFLSLDPGCEVLVVERLRTANSIPVLLDRSFFPHDRFSFLEDAKLDGQVSIFAEICAQTGSYPKQAPGRTIEIVRAGQEVAEALDVPVDEPLFLMKSNFLDASGEAFFVGWQYVVGSRFKLST